MDLASEELPSLAEVDTRESSTEPAKEEPAQLTRIELYNSILLFLMKLNSYDSNGRGNYTIKTSTTPKVQFLPGGFDKMMSEMPSQLKEELLREGQLLNENNILFLLEWSVLCQCTKEYSTIMTMMGNA